MIPVIDNNKQALMPCSPKRARKLMQKGEAKPYWQKGIFCICLTKEPSCRKYQDVAIGTDPGSKREGYTAITSKRVVLNITSNTPTWVKAHLEARRALRRARRYRKTPYRACRENRSVLRNAKRVPPSTKARWDAKLRILKLLFKILPISVINIEDIQARTLKGKKNWNNSFSPLQVGKLYFEEQASLLFPNIRLIKTSGRETKAYRDKRGFAKSKSKLEYIWEAHNVDSHCLAELALQAQVEPYLGLYKIEFLQFYRRQLHIQNPIKDRFRRKYGTTISSGMSRGAVLKDTKTNKLCFLGGESKAGYVAIHSIITGLRIKIFKKTEELKMLYNSKWRTQFLPRLKPWVSLRDYL